MAEIGYVTSPSTVGWWSARDDEDTPELRWPHSVEVYDRMRRQDGQIMSVLRAVALPIRRTGWSIDGTGCDPEVTAFVASAMGLPVHGSDATPTRTKDRFSWPEHLRMALTALTFGHAFFEQVYRPENGRLTLHKLAWRPPRTIQQVSVAADGGLESISQFGSKRPIPVDRLVAYVFDREGGNWLGQSILRPAYKYWLLKDRALRVQSMTLERNGLGIPVYVGPEAPQGLTTDGETEFIDRHMEAGQKIASSLRSGEQAGVAVPHGADVRLTGVTGNLPDADAPIRYYDEQIARSVLAHFLNLGTETGSWALGSTFADFFTMSLQTIAEWVADTTNRHVIEDLVDVNFGADVPAPRLTFEEIGSQQPATAASIQSLIQVGALQPDDTLEAYLRARYGLPPGDPSTTRAPQGVAHA